MLSVMERAVRWFLEWWGEHWVRVQLVAVPFGSLLITLYLSQTGDVGWWLNSRADYKVAAEFASLGFIIYAASFAALETGVWLVMVLALYALEAFDRRRAERDQEVRSEAAVVTARLVVEFGKEAALALIERAEDERMRGETWKQAIERLRQEG